MAARMTPAIRVCADDGLTRGSFIERGQRFVEAPHADWDLLHPSAWRTPVDDAAVELPYGEG
jgi:hypothetical protein